MVSFGNVKWLVKFTSAIQFHGDMRGVWFRVLCDVLRTRSTFRDEDNSPLRKGNLCDYVDRAWGYSFLAQNLRKGTKKIPHMQTYAEFSFIFLTFFMHWGPQSKPA